MLDPMRPVPDGPRKLADLGKKARTAGTTAYPDDVRGASCFKQEEESGEESERGATVIHNPLATYPKTVL